MAVSKKAQRKVPKDIQIRESITKAVEALYDAHAGEIADFRDQSEESKVTVTFGVDIDCSESEPKVKVSIRFSKSVTDSRVATLDDPDQLNLLTPEEFARQKADGAKARSEAGDGE